MYIVTLKSYRLASVRRVDATNLDPVFYSIIQTLIRERANRSFPYKIFIDKFIYLFFLFQNFRESHRLPSIHVKIDVRRKKAGKYY